MKKILVTGGAGYIGSHTVTELYKSDYEAVILDDFSNTSKIIVDGLIKIIGKKPKVYKFDYKDIHKLNELIKKENIEGIVHFAAFKSVDESIKDPIKYYENNVAGLICLLKNMQKCGVKHLVFSSSATVYGESQNLPIKETEPLKEPTSPYGATKQMGERIIKDAIKSKKGLSAVSLRYFNPIGAHESGYIGEFPLGRPANLVPFITQVAAGLRDELTVYGDDYPTKDGTCIRDYIHVLDLAKAHVNALDWLFKQKADTYDVFNIGTGDGNSVMELIKTFEQVSGVELNYKIGPRRDGDIVQSYASNTKAKSVLGWEHTKTLEDSLRDSWRWQKSLLKLQNNN